MQQQTVMDRDERLPGRVAIWGVLIEEAREFRRRRVDHDVAWAGPTYEGMVRAKLPVAPRLAIQGTPAPETLVLRDNWGQSRISSFQRHGVGTMIFDSDPN